MLGIAAEETERQRETLPKAVRRVSHRIVFYYVGAVFVLGLNLSANDPILGKRLSGPYYPGAFITMVQRANVPELAPVINVVMIIAAISVANADIYVGVKHPIDRLTCRVELCTHWPARDMRRNFSKSKTDLKFLIWLLQFQRYLGRLLIWDRNSFQAMYCSHDLNSEA
jgi:hypothetical protein